MCARVLECRCASSGKKKVFQAQVAEQQHRQWRKYGPRPFSDFRAYEGQCIYYMRLFVGIVGIYSYIHFYVTHRSISSVATNIK